MPMAQLALSRTRPLPHTAPLDARRPYAERADDNPSWLDPMAERLFAATVSPVRGWWAGTKSQRQQIVDRTLQCGVGLDAVSDDELRQRARALKRPIRREGFTLDLSAQAFALIREAAHRAMGKRHFETQLMAGYNLLQGHLIEMATGEGKTFSASLAACTVALAGYPVHVITVNDYLAERDAHEMAPLYSFLGLSVGSVIQGMQKPERRAAYARDITYASNKELAFDYLRDRTTQQGSGSAMHRALHALGTGHAPAGDGDLVLRGLYFCIVDEADSVFVDEARTPLILSASQASPDEALQFEQALGFAGNLVEGDDFILNDFTRAISLTDEGKERLTAFAKGLSGVWASARAGEELIRQALSAVHFYTKDEHYVVAEGKVQIVDESTGRVMPDRSWERGLHQLIEAKEGCALTDRRITLARLTYQRLFKRYIRLSGMTGTGAEVAREIKQVYGLDVVRIPLYRPLLRKQAEPMLCETADDKWARVVASAAAAQQAGRAVLIGTRSVAASEHISALLTQGGVQHALLNAKQDRAEADVITNAGQAGAVTVATNMAGRGTDIKLGEGVSEAGGLHVILTEYHESSRVDRQLFGRCGRQGDPGSCEAIVSLQDDIFVVCAPQATEWVRSWIAQSRQVPSWMVNWLRQRAQGVAEARNSAARIQNLKADQRQSQVLSFSGRSE
jgi:preprotein translocase subunit SecA